MHDTVVLELPRLVSIKSAARSLGISPYKATLLPVRSYRLGSQTFLSADDLADLFAARIHPKRANRAV